MTYKLGCSKPNVPRGERKTEPARSGDCRTDIMATAHIVLDQETDAALNRLARQMGKTREALIREAAQRFIGEFRTANRAALLQQARGMWRDRTDLPHLERLRSELDRF